MSRATDSLGQPTNGRQDDFRVPDPLVTVITPTYQHCRFIEQCLASVRAQTERRWEQIVVDDGSTDGTAEAVAAQDDPRVHLIRNEHRGIDGLAAGYNTALSLARGTFVAVLEGDDFWPPDKLERQLPAFAAREVVLSWGLAGETDPAGKVRRIIPDPRRIASLGGLSRGKTILALLAENEVPACTVLCRREALLAAGGFHQPPGIPTVDLPTWLELARLGRFAPIDALLGYYRRYPEQITAVMPREMSRTIAWRTSFIASIPAAERASLGISVGQARRIERRTRAAGELFEGRADVRAGRRRLAAVRFRRALRGGSLRTRVAALAALVAVWTAVDPDCIFDFARSSAAGQSIRGEGRLLAASETEPARPPKRRATATASKPLAEETR